MQMIPRAAAGTGRLVVVEFSRIKDFPLFDTVGPCQEVQKAAVGMLQDNPSCSLLRLLVALLFASPGSCKWLSRHFKQPSACSGPAFAACHHQHELCHPKEPGSAAQALLRTFPRLSGKPQLIERPKMKPGQGKTCES